MKPFWLDFEGIDGSGKTTVSTRVAEALRKRGLPVVHAREGGTFASPIAGRVRELARSVECLHLAPETELLLNLAREAQLVAEVVRPALRQGAWVITDRTTYSHLGLARSVRGLGAPEIEAAARVATQGLRPDRVFLIDVDPDVARWRRRIRKIHDRRLSEGGRKGQMGEALMSRTRRAFQEMASAGRWTVLDNTWCPLEETVAAVLAALDGEEAAPAFGPRFEADPENLLPGFLDFVASVADRSLAAMLAAGIDHPRADEIRRAAPAEIAAFAVAGMDAPAAWALRRDLRDEAPHSVALGLTGLVGHPEAWDLRRALEPKAPDAVLHSLSGEPADEAHAMRERHWEDRPDEAVRSTRGVADERAWAFRGRARRERPSAALAESLLGLDTPEAWEIRSELRERHPLAVVKGLKGVDHPAAWDLRNSLARPAAKSVLGSIAGLDGAEAWALRASLRSFAPEETAESMAGMDTPEAWRWRFDLRDQAPVGVIKSLRRVEGPWTERLTSDVVAAHSRRLRVAREAVQFVTRPLASSPWNATSI